MKGRSLAYAILVFVALLVGYYDLWQARAAGGPFEWRRDQNGFYNLLARGFVGGHLYVPIEPSPRLLALPNPWDPAVEDALRWQDMALYRGRYYLYFGAAPAALLFAPWRLATGHDLPEAFAICVLCFGGFLFSAGALLRVLELAQARPGPLLLGFLFLALGVCQSAPFLLNRVAVYEVAIASGYFCVSAAVFFLARGVGPGGSGYALAASGLMFGLAVASRPHLILGGAIALAGLAIYHWRRPKAILAFAAAWCLVGAAVAVYNYERFGNPLEFGFRYQLAGPGQNRIELAPRNLAPGAYYMLLARPEFSRVFPWMRMVFRFPFDSAERHPLPPEYFVEPTVGALWVAPFLFAVLLLRTRGAKHPAEVRLLAGTALVSGLAVLLFLISTHLASHRYEVDFVPLLVFAAVASLALTRSRTVAAIGCVLIAYSTLANLALGLAGPYDEFLKNRPASYVRLARRFSPMAEFRRAINPAIDLGMVARFGPAPAGYRDPLVTIGGSHYHYFLYAEHAPGGIQLVSQSNDSRLEFALPDAGPAPVTIQLAYAPDRGEMRVSVDGREALVHHVGMLVTAPAQVAIGENFADFGLTARRFNGELTVLRKQVVEAAR